MKALRTLAALSGVLLIPGMAEANPLDTFGFGSRGAGMGGAVAADVTDASAGYYNPAGLASAKGLELTVGYFRADHTLSTEGRDNHVDAVKGVVGGLVAPGTVAGVPFAFGLAVHLPDDRVSRIRALKQEQPRWELYDNRNQRLFLSANVALKPVPWLELGGGLSFLSSTGGRLDIEGLANILDPERSQLRHEVDADLTAVRYPQAGVRLLPHKRVALAFVYRGEFSLRLDLAARVQGNLSELTTARYALTTSTVNAFLPRQVVFGVHTQPTDDLSVNVDVTWMNWSAYIPPVAHLSVDLDIPPPVGGWPTGVTPPTSPVATPVLPIGMKDRLVPRLGVECRAITTPSADLFVRGGYEFAKSPLPPQRGFTNYVDRDRHGLSLGLGLRLPSLGEWLPGELRWDVHGQLHVLTSEVTVKDDPTDAVGDYEASGHITNVGTSLTLGFR